ncbi:MAG TPA: hypothetical protein VK818_16550 [Methylomirabilota bacterium]|jgi:hypothetical protein|nr:hypothetical protein [Methylomirabilota bacterium]
MKLAAELEASLREFVSAGAAELCENGGRLAPLSKLSWEVRGSDDKPLLHIWSEQYDLTRRVIAITDIRTPGWCWPWNALADLVRIASNLCVSISNVPLAN